jgi:hypothetical protein
MTDTGFCLWFHCAAVGTILLKLVNINIERRQLDNDVFFNLARRYDQFW